MGRFGIKIIALLLLVSLCAFVISLVLMDAMLQVSTATMRGHAQELENELKGLVPVYRELVVAKKRLYDDIGKRIANSHHLTQAVWSREESEVTAALRLLAKQHPDVKRLAVRDHAEKLVAQVGIEGEPGGRYRVFNTIGGTGWTLVVGFSITRDLQRRFQKIGRKLDEGVHLKRIERRSLQHRYVPVFMRFFGVAMLVVTVVGLLFARRLAQRVARLSQATRKVAAGDLEVAVPTKSRDEIGQLYSAFNEMVAELRRNRAQIAYLQKISAWQEVARRLAHEIKNPLTPILLAMQQVQQKYEGEDSKFRTLLDEATEIVKEEIDGLRRLVEAFSAFAKLPTVQTEPEEVGAIMDDFLRSLGSLEEKGEVDWQAPEPAFSVQVDKLLFRRVLYNLVENAFQAATESGHRPLVEIRARRLPHSGVGLITVTDNGPGIPEDLRDRVFDPYFTTKISGTGLGLAIVKKIVLEHGGSIDVETPSRGGTRFTIRVPVADPAKRQAS